MIGIERESQTAYERHTCSKKSELKRTQTIPSFTLNGTFRLGSSVDLLDDQFAGGHGRLGTWSNQGSS